MRKVDFEVQTQMFVCWCCCFVKPREFWVPDPNRRKQELEQFYAEMFPECKFIQSDEYLYSAGGALSALFVVRKAARALIPISIDSMRVHAVPERPA